MVENENKKELADEALEKVAGGLEPSENYKMFVFRKAFADNNCYGCSMESSDVCFLWLDDKELYNMFGGNPNAKCQYFKSIF